MKPTMTRNVGTVILCLVIAVSLPLTLIGIFRAMMSRFITRDNASIIFDQFQSALDHGSVVRDSVAVSDVATTAYWNKTQAIPLDGWGHQVRISGVVHGNSCQMTVLSAGSDGAFGTGDDVAFQRSFDLTAKKSKPDVAAPQ
jgi:hypothetical protein